MSHSVSLTGGFVDTPKPLPTPGEKRAAILDTAKEAVCRDRQNSYGDAEDNFQDIADILNVLFDHKLELDQGFASQDVATICAVIKLSRIKSSPDHIDNWVDLAGYAACGGGIMS